MQHPKKPGLVQKMNHPSRQGPPKMEERWTNQTTSGVTPGCCGAEVWAEQPAEAHGFGAHRGRYAATVAGGLEGWSHQGLPAAATLPPITHHPR